MAKALVTVIGPNVSCDPSRANQETALGLFGGLESLGLAEKSKEMMRSKGKVKKKPKEMDLEEENPLKSTESPVLAPEALVLTAITFSL